MEFQINNVILREIRQLGNFVIKIDKFNLPAFFQERFEARFLN